LKAEFPLCRTLTVGKTKVVVRFQAHPVDTAGDVFGLRMMRTDAVGTTLIWEQEAGEWVLRIDTKPADDPNPSRYWFHSGNKPPLGTWATPDQWTFLAAVWKKADNKVTFYQGSSSAAAVLARESTRSETVAPLNERADSPRTIGNRVGAILDRPFDGSIDDVRFYPKALDAATIEKIRQADLQNSSLSLP
jgi:hypothetical protein